MAEVSESMSAALIRRTLIAAWRTNLAPGALERIGRVRQACGQASWASDAIRGIAGGRDVEDNTLLLTKLRVGISPALSRSNEAELKS